MKISVPEAVRLGDAALLTCNFDISGNTSLYALKWFFQNEEFYRYVPNKRDEPKKAFTVRGLQVNVSIFFLSFFLINIPARVVYTFGLRAEKERENLIAVKRTPRAELTRV